MLGNINLSDVCRFLLVETLNLIRKPNEHQQDLEI